MTDLDNDLTDDSMSDPDFAALDKIISLIEESSTEELNNFLTDVNFSGDYIFLDMVHNEIHDRTTEAGL